MAPQILMLVAGRLRPLPDRPSIGGAARQALKLTSALRELGVEARVVSLRRHRQTPKAEVIDDVPVKYLDSLLWVLNRKGTRRLEVALRVGVLLIYLVSKYRTYDIIHVHTAATATALAGVLAGRWLGKPTILKTTNSGKRNDIYRFRSGSGLPVAGKLVHILKHTTRIIALNAGARQELLSEGFSSNQVVHIPNGVEVDCIQPKLHYVTNGPVRLLYVGRLHPSKRIDLLFEAVALLRARALPYHLTLVGNGPEREALLRQARRLCIADRIEFAGQVGDVTPFLQTADVFVLPSSTEGISNALLEAMAAGLPCIATSNSGNLQVLSDAETGLLVPIDDVAALAEGLESLVRDVALRERLGRAARRQVVEQFDITRIAEAYQALYLELVEEEKK